MLKTLSLKIVFLNTWNGKIREEFSDFIKKQSIDTDIFCFQEAYDEMRQLAIDILPDYNELAAYKFVIEDDDFPQATYIRKNIEVISSGTILENQKNTGLGIFHEIKVGENNVFITNFHGISKPGNKLDNPERILQSESLIKFWKDKPGLKIIGGDFNLFPETKSIKMFTKNRYRDLIKEYKVPTTRNRLAWEMYPDNPQLFSDYVFLSPEISVNSFSVIDNKISDHLPMILEIE